MKKIFTLSFGIFLFSHSGYSQFLKMKNRSAWKNPSNTSVIPTQQEKIKTSETPAPSHEVVEADTAKQLNEFVVTATRTEKKIEETGRSITVISSDEIKNSGANTVADALSLAEGIYITGTQQNFGANQSLFIRGTNSNQSLVMIDGIVIADPSTPGGALDLSELSLMDVDHIEIVRGSHSTMYGSSAIGGVINIITNKKMKEGLSVNVTGTAGSFGKGTALFSENLGATYSCKSGFYAGMNIAGMDVSGQDATVDTSTIPSKLLRDKDGMNRFDMGGKIGFRNEKWNLFFSVKNFQRHADLDAAPFTDKTNYGLDFTRRLYSYGISYRHDSTFIFSFNGGYSSMQRTVLNDSSLINTMGAYDGSYSKVIYSGTTLINELQFHFKKKYFDFLLGGGANEQTMNSQLYSYWHGFVYEENLDSLKLASRTYSAFALVDVNGSSFSEKAKAFSFSLGGRINQNNIFKSSNTVQFSPRVKISPTSTLYANFSSGYNAPSLYQLYSPSTDSVKRGNVNLRPETSTTQEIGLYQKLSEKTGMRIGYFQTFTRNVIEYVYIWDKNTPVNSLTFADYRGDTYMNLGTLFTEGIEMEAHGAIGKKFLLAGNFTYIRGHQLNSYESVDTVKSKGNHVQLFSTGQFISERDVHTTALPRRPSTGNISLTYMPTEKIFVRTIVKMVSGRKDIVLTPGIDGYGAQATSPLQPFTLVDLIAGAKFDSNISAIVRVENIFNVNYTEILGYTTRGRGVYLTVHYNF